MAPGADAVLALVSGIPLVGLGLLFLVVRPWRRQQVFFGAFAILWGIQVVTANLGRVACDGALHHVMLLVSHAFMATATLALAHFAGISHGGARSWVPGAVAAGVGLTGWAVLITRPDLLVVSATTVGCRPVTTYGPLLAPLFQIPFFLTFVLATLHLHHAYRRARPGTHRHRLRGIILALTLFASYQFMRTTIAFVDFGDPAEFASSAVITSSRWSGLLLVVSFVAGTAVLGGLALFALLRPPPPEAPDTPLFFAFAAPALIALAEGVFQDLDILTLETLGFWRLVSVCVLVYTLAHHQLFGLDLRLKRLAGPGTAGAIGLFGVPLALSLASGNYGLRASFLTLIPEVIAIGAVLVFRQELGERLFPGVSETADYQQQRHLELYKVAVEDAVARGQDPDGPDLVSLRARFGITDEAHRLILWMIKGQGGHDDHQRGTPLHPGQVVLGRYRLERTLGERTQRETLIATDLRSRQKVVVKAVALDAYDGAGVALLLREARLGASITHPNLLAVFDVAEEAGHAIIVMDYADMGSLEDRISTVGAFDRPAAIRFCTELLSGLAALHEHRIVHRNLKPQNILLDADGSVLISDLSAAEAPHGDQAQGDGEAHGEGAALATQLLYDPLYLSPEQLLGLSATPQSDLYVAGVLFHIVLTGRYPLPITGRSDAQIRSIIIHHPYEAHLDEGSAWARPLLERALQKDPADRHATASEMLSELRRLAGLRPNDHPDASASPRRYF